MNIQKKKQNEEDQKPKEESIKQQLAATITASSSPPSASSSPSHEFSFTISLHPSSAVVPRSSSPPNSFAIDLSPADDIFFHGHLLPLHLLSHLPISPRASTTSYDSFCIPIDHDPILNRTKSINNNTYKGKPKAKSFSLFRFSRRRKGSEEEREKDEEQEIKKKKRKLRFNVSHIFRRYVRIIRPLLIFKGARNNGQLLRRQSYSFSGNLSWKGQHDELRGRRRGELSAPASLYPSPTNSGPLALNSGLPCSKSDSTMEELQSAIQAAIAHCKNSVTVDQAEKLNSSF